MKIIIAIALLSFCSSLFARDIGLSDTETMWKAKSANLLRFKKEYDGSRFSAQAKFDSISNSPTFLIPGYFVSFKSGAVGITCVTANTKTLSFIEKLNKGDLVQIDAIFKGDDLSDTSGFLFQNCKISKPK